MINILHEFVLFSKHVFFWKNFVMLHYIKTFCKAPHYKKERSNIFIKSSDIIDDENYEIGNKPSCQRMKFYIKFVFHQIIKSFSSSMNSVSLITSFLPVLITLLSFLTFDFIFSINLACILERLMIIRLTTSEAFPEIFIC